MWTSTSAVGCVCRERQRVESAPYGAHASVSEGAKAVCAVCECVVVLVRPRGWHRTPRPPRGPRPAPAGRVSEAIKWTGARHGAVKAQGQGDTKGAARETRSWKRTPLDTTIADKTQNEYRKRIYKFGTGRDGRCGDRRRRASGRGTTLKPYDLRYSVSPAAPRAEISPTVKFCTSSAGGHPQTTKRVPPYGPEQTSRMYRLKCVSTHRARSNTQGRGHGLTASPSV